MDAHPCIAFAKSCPLWFLYSRTAFRTALSRGPYRNFFMSYILSAARSFFSFSALPFIVGKISCNPYMGFSSRAAQISLSSSDMMISSPLSGSSKILRPSCRIWKKSSSNVPLAYGTTEVIGRLLGRPMRSKRPIRCSTAPISQGISR